MRFEVTRTSGYWGQPPCPEAVRAKIPSWDKRTSPSPEQHDVTMAARFSPPPPPWLSEGTDHCTTPNGIARRRKDDDDGWTVEIPSIEALVEFVGRHGEVVISEQFGSFPRIEIYDDYRE